MEYKINTIYCDFDDCIHNENGKCGLRKIHLCDGNCEDLETFDERGYKILELTEENLTDELQAVTSDKPKFFIIVTQAVKPNTFLTSDINILDYETANKIYKILTRRNSNGENIKE